MATPNELSIEFTVVSPLFMGGAGQSGEVRPPSFKGLLRFWYRAIDPKFRQPLTSESKIPRESVFFGGTAQGSGQSPFMLRLEDQGVGHWKWDERLVKSFDRTVQRPGKKSPPRNGLAYLGFPFKIDRGESGKADRTAIDVGARLRVRCLFPKGFPEPELRQSLAASLWCLGHLGGAGSRARRGFGSLTLRSWSNPSGDEWPELRQLPLLVTSPDAKAWRGGLESGLRTIRSWFGPFQGGFQHPHLGEHLRIVLFPDAFPLPAWSKALDRAGRLMQDFRQLSQPDLGNVRSHLLRERGLSEAPERATFGLPLTFRIGRLGPLEILPYNTETHSTDERQGSLLFIRLVEAQDGLHPLFVRLAGAVPAVDPRAAIRKQSRPLRTPGNIALNAFMDHLEEEARRG